MAFSSNRPATSALSRYPIPVELIAALYRADDNEFDRLVAPMSDYGRARVAVYCAERAKLRPLGLRIARHCEESALVRAAGAPIGASLFTESRDEAATAH